jgi:hypothetical protein
LERKEWVTQIAKKIAFANLSFEELAAKDRFKKNTLCLYEIYLATQMLHDEGESTLYFDQFSDSQDYRVVIKQCFDSAAFDSLQKRVREMPPSATKDKWVYQIANFLNFSRRFADSNDFFSLYQDVTKRPFFNQKCKMEELKVLLEEDPVKVGEEVKKEA